jgi:precorrin-2/cobalt-factor-2 C20-methyltransferase
MRLVGVGMGPGDPQLITLKAVALLRTADRVFVPVASADDAGYIEAVVRAHVEPDRLERLVLGSPADGAAAGRVAEYLRNVGTGACVVVATIGDPNVYSAFPELAQAIRAAMPQLVVESVPGVIAAQHLASRSGVPLAEGAEPFTLLPLSGGVNGLAEALGRPGSVVSYQSGHHLAGIKEAVRRAGRLHGAIFGAHLGHADESVRPLAAADAGAAPYLSAVFVPARRTARGQP